ncbi:hypothetical protein ACSBR1_021314 [Camellia fascicularis]
MRDMASCFSEYAIQVSDASCSSHSITNHSCISPNPIPSIQNSITSLYKISLSTQKNFLITATWSKNTTTNQGLTINFGEENNSHPSSFKLNTNSKLLRKKKKGHKYIEFDNSKFEIFWDFSAAKYSTNGPEPIDGYYVLLIIDSELGLVLGTTFSDEAVMKRLKSGTKLAKSSLISRREHFSGNTLYSTKARFSDSGDAHDILIRCSGENEGLKSPVLSVCVDKKPVIRVKRLQWNFRGNQTIFVDGLLIDLMWDVHDWFFNNPASSGYAVFMFRTRRGMESRLWLLEEKVVQKEQEKLEFSLFIYACKTP